MWPTVIYRQNAKMFPVSQDSGCRDTAVPHGSCVADQSGEVLRQLVKQQKPTMNVGSQMSLCRFGLDSSYIWVFGPSSTPFSTAILFQNF